MLEVIGVVLLSAGAFFELVAAIGFLRFPSFYTRMHALTVGAVGGTVLPLIGIAFLSLSRRSLDPQWLYLASLCIVTAVLVLIVAPTGSHALIRSAYLHEKRKEEEREER